MKPALVEEDEAFAAVGEEAELRSEELVEESFSFLELDTAESHDRLGVEEELLRGVLRFEVEGERGEFNDIEG